MTDCIFCKIINGDFNTEFVYENEYAQDYVEKAYLRRISSIPDKSKSTSFINQAKPYTKAPLLRR